MDVKLKVAAAVFVVAGVCSTIALWSDGEPEAHPAGIAAAPVVPETASPVEKAPRSPLEHVAPAGREAGEGAPPAAEANPAAAPRSPARLAGRVIDVDGSPVSAVRVGFFDPEHGESPRGEARADARGVFELDLPTTKGRLDVLGEEWTALLRPEFASPPDPSDSREIVLVVARGARLSGAVVDEFGRGVEGASLLVAMPFGLRSRFDGVLDRSSLVERRATSAADGSFDLAGVPLVAGAVLETQHARYLPDERPLPEAGDLDLEIVLRPVTAEPARLVGTVVDPDGVPVAGAWVALGEESAKTGTAGAFSFEKGSDAASIRAVKQGFLPGSVARPVGGSWPDPLVLRLGEPPLAIEGRVVDADGKPVEHALVWTDSEERFGFVEIEGGEMSMKAGANVEGILRGDPWTRRIRADAFGRFALKGLLPKDYGVHALDQDRLVAATVQIAAGMRDVEIRMPREDVHERIAGRVTSLGGEPVEGIEVRLERPMEGVKWSEVEPILGLAARTDEEGRFEFRDVSRGVAAIRLEGQELGLMGFEKALRAEDDLEDLEIAAPMQVHVQVDAGGRKDFDEVSVLDEKGEKLYLALHHGHSAYAMREVPLQGERTETFAVTELGRTLVLYRGETEVQRLAVKLSRGAVNTIRP